jgi:hypothetical protein
VTNEQAVARILELYCKRDSVREDLAKNADIARVQLREIFQRLVSNARKPDSAG